MKLFSSVLLLEDVNNDYHHKTPFLILSYPVLSLSTCTCVRTCSKIMSVFILIQQKKIIAAIALVVLAIVLCYCDIKHSIPFLLVINKYFFEFCVE